MSSCSWTTRLLARHPESIRFLTEKAGKDDTVIFFISGHGDVSEGEGYLIPYRADPKNLKDSAYPMASLFTLMYEMSAKVGRFVLFVDACRSGMIGQITEKNAINRVLAKALKESADNVTALLASQQTELAFEHENFGSGEGHSAFSYFLLAGNGCRWRARGGSRRRREGVVRRVEPVCPKQR